MNNEEAINSLVRLAHQNSMNHGFHDAETSIRNILISSRGGIAPTAPLDRAYEVQVKLSKLMLITTEVAEAAEAARRGDYVNYAEELADILIRVFDEAGRIDINLGYHVTQKMEKNEGREHMHGGKLA